MIAESSDRTVAIEVTDGRVIGVEIDRVTYNLPDDKLCDVIAEVVQALIDDILRPRHDMDTMIAGYQQATAEAMERLGAMFADRDRTLSRMREITDEFVAHSRRIDERTNDR